MPQQELTKHLQEALALTKQQALSQFVNTLAAVLRAQGFTLDQLIDALADYADQRPEFQGAVKSLEDASMAITRETNQSSLG